MATLGTIDVDVDVDGVGGRLCQDIRISIYTYTNTDWACTRSLCCYVCTWWLNHLRGHLWLRGGFVLPLVEALSWREALAIVHKSYPHSWLRHLEHLSLCWDQLQKQRRHC